MLELNHKVFEITPEVDLSQEKDIRVIVNDEDRGVRLQEVFKIKKLTEGEISGWSILEYYQIKNGMLTDRDGNAIYLATEKHPKILFTDITTPIWIESEIEVSRNYVRDVGLLMKLVNTELTITGLDQADKKALKEERDAKLREAEEAEKKAKEDSEREEREALEAAERAKQEEEEQKAAQEKEQAEAREKAEAEARAEAEAKAKAEEDMAKAKEEEEAKRKKEMEDSEYYLTNKDYKAAQKKYTRLGFVEYTQDGYHFFYGESEGDNQPFILAEREFGFMEELPGGVSHEDEETVEYEFTEGEEEKTLTLNLDEEKFTIVTE